MKLARGKHGFSLVELLTVIAIIAILAAIIFPVMATVKARAKTVQCMTNLQQIASALKMFQMDNRRYPETLGNYVQYNSGGALVPFDKTTSDPTHLSLYPEYVKSVSVFHCPLSSTTNTRIITTLSVGSPAQTFQYYTYDSYDVYMPNPAGGGADINSLRYTPMWADGKTFDQIKASVMQYEPFDDYSNTDDGIKQDYKRQLRFRQPSDDTVVTWCSFHRRLGDNKAMIPVLFLDGHADMMSASIVEGSNGAGGCRWRTDPKK